MIDSYNDLPDDSVFKTEQVYNALKEIQNIDLKQYVSMEKITSYIKGAVGIARGVFDIFVANSSIYVLRRYSSKSKKRFPDIFRGRKSTI